MFNYIKSVIFGRKKAEQEKPLNLYEYKFIRYKKERNRLYPLDLEKVKTSEEKGLISVVLPVYNGADMVSKSIDSVLSQTEKNFEFIIINDGSTDSTKEIIESYAKKDSRIRVINQENRRIPRTLSRGFSLAKGEFFTWTSADNIMLPTCLEKMKNELLKNPDAAMVYGNMRLINEKGKIYKGNGWFEFPPGSGNVIFPETTYELNTYPNNTIGAAFMYRSKAALALGCYSSYKHTLEDYDYWMRMNSLFKIIHTSYEEPLYYYRWHSGSLTAKDKELGITKNRYKLMLLDDARRDFYLSPLMWFLKSDAEHKDLSESFKAEALKRGHLVFEEEDLKNLYFGKYSFGFSAVYFGNAETGDFLPGSPKKVCITDDPAKKTESCGYNFLLGEKTEEGFLAAFSDMENLFSFADIMLRNDFMYEKEGVIESGVAAKKELSFVLCTNKYSKGLEECIFSLANQTCEKEKYEIIFVNNGSSDSRIKELAQSALKENPSLCINYITAPVKGLSHARNAGLWEADGEIVLFIDDDADAEPNLAKEAIKTFGENPDAGIIGGNIILKVPDGAEPLVTATTRPLWSELKIESKGYKTSADYGEFPYGANFAARRQTLWQMGGFRAMYGRVGENFGGGEETLACFLAGEMGQKVGLCPDMTVWHKVDAARFNEDHITKTAYSGLMTQYCLRRDVYAPQDWNDRTVEEQIRKSEAEIRKTERGTPDRLYFEARKRAWEDILAARRRDYEFLSTYKKKK